MTKPKPRPRGPAPPTPQQREAVLKLLLQGFSWHRAVREVVLNADGTKLRPIVFKFRSDPELQQLLIAEVDKLQQIRAQGRERLLMELDESIELARDKGNGTGITRGVMAKATLLGLDRNMDPDDFSRKWELMTPAEQKAYLSDGLSRLILLRARLEDKAITDATAGATTLLQGD